MTNWDGREHRSANVTLNDVLLEVREVNNDVKYLKEKMMEHIVDDKKTFEAIRRDVTWSQRIIFGLIGAWAIIQFLVSSGIIRFNYSIPGSYNSSSAHGDSSDAYVGQSSSAIREGSVAGTSSNQ